MLIVCNESVNGEAWHQLGSSSLKHQTDYIKANTGPALSAKKEIQGQENLNNKWYND